MGLAILLMTGVRLPALMIFHRLYNNWTIPIRE